MSPARKIIVYSTIRIALFAAPFAGLMLLNVVWWASALIAAVIATCLSYLFLNRQRDELSTIVDSWRHGDRSDSDNDVENEAIDRSDSAVLPSDPRER